MKRVATALACTMFAAVACAECAQTMPATREYKQSGEVIVGTVQSSRPVPQSWDTLDGTDFVVHIDQKVKGKQSKEITIFSEHSQDGFPLKIGEQYLLFLSSNYQRWEVNKCGNSSTLDNAGPVIKQLSRMLGNY